MPQLLRPDRRQSGDEDDRLVLRQLHHLAGGEQRPGRLLPAHHHMAEPGREPMAGIIALSSELGCGSERVRNTPGGALVIGRKGNAHMAVVENGVILAVGRGDLVERLGDQIDPHPIAGHEGERAFEEVEPTKRRKLVEHHQKLALLRAAFDSAERFGEAAADLVENKPDQRLGAADVGGRHHEIERDRLLGYDQVGDPPVAGLGGPGDGRIAIKTEEAHRGREHPGALVLGLVEQLPRGRGDHGVNLRPLVRAEMVGRHHDAQRLLKRLRRIGEQLGHPRERLPLLGIEDMQDDAHEEGVARLLPMIAPLQRSLRVDQDVGDVLHVADFRRAFAHFEQWVVARAVRIGRIEQEAMGELRPPSRRQLPVLALDVVYDRRRGPGQQRRQDKADALA